MKTSAMRRWLREQRALEHGRFLSETELPASPTETSWFMVDQPAVFRWRGPRTLEALRKALSTVPQ